MNNMDSEQNSPNHIELRSSTRKSHHLDAKLTVDRDENYVKLVDVSLGGICVISTKKLNPGLRCRIDFPLSVSEQHHAIAVIARVRYCLFCRVGFRVGLQIIDMINKDQSIELATFLRR